jgi:Arc/MetJ family transcription regulator
MTIDYTITLSAAEDKALSYAAMSQQEWIDNAVHERCRIAIDDLVQITVAKCLETGTQIPSSKDAMVDLAFEQGWVKSAADRQAEARTQLTGGA